MRTVSSRRRTRTSSFVSGTNSLDVWPRCPPPLHPTHPTPPQPSAPPSDFPTLPPEPWLPARRTARWRRRKTTTRRERRAPSRQHGSLSTTSPWRPGKRGIQAPARLLIGGAGWRLHERLLLFIGLCVKPKVPVQLAGASAPAGRAVCVSISDRKEARMEVFPWVLGMNECPGRLAAAIQTGLTAGRPRPAALPTLPVISIAGLSWHWSPGPGH